MILEKITSEGIAHNSYLLGSRNEAAVIDPRRDGEVYVQRARALGLKITSIFETHRNEDYVIGSMDLSRITGASIFHGTHLAFSYGTGVSEGDVVPLGSLEITVLETPGHTEESISLAVRERDVSDEVLMIFTGDALFAGDVGRTDFYPLQKEGMAGKLHASIWTKILSLGDGVVIYPAHGEGSSCGEAISDREITTVGYEKKGNPLLRMNRKEFIDYKVREHHYTPPYFRKMEELNIRGAPLLTGIPLLRPLSPTEIRDYRAAGAQIVDIRAPTSFGGGFIPGSISIWREGLATFIGWMLTYQDPIILIDDFNLDLDRVTRQFLRLGYDNLLGYCAGGFPAWFKAGFEMEVIEQWTPPMIHERLDPSLYLLDVRSIGNWNTMGHIKGAHHCWVGELRDHLDEIPKDRLVVAYCDAGYKGNMAASLLRKEGYPRVVNLLGGMAAWKQYRYEIIR
ncbi:MAG: MBL fold metallo-hydrolase [Methanomicrobiales archaeon]|nr:MBL fold metallo-hydrolase [Methanomicrobiales archaeon]